MTIYYLQSKRVNDQYDHKLLDGTRKVICEGTKDHVRGKPNLPDSTVLAYIETNELELSRRGDVIRGLEIKFDIEPKK